MILSMILGALYFANSRRQYSGVIIRRSDRDIRQSSFSQDSFQEHSLTFNFFQLRKSRNLSFNVYGVGHRGPLT